MPGSTFIQDNSNTGPVSGGAVAVTASDVTVYDPPLRGIVLGGSGLVALVFADASTMTMTLATGVLHPITGISKVMSTGTTATPIYGFRG